MDLTDEQWAVLEPLVPTPRVRADGRGRPWRDPRDVLNGMLWILKTGALVLRSAVGVQSPQSVTRFPLDAGPGKGIVDHSQML